VGSKGWFALLLRLDPSRPSNDIDVTYVHSAGEHAIALRALEYDLGDFFGFEIVSVGDETEDRARRVTVLCRLGAREFNRLRVDLAIPRPDVDAEQIEVGPLSGVEELDTLPPVLVLSWSQQIAEKVCAIFERHGDAPSPRSRDLADLGIVAMQIDGLDGDSLIAALRQEEKRRRDRTLPEGLPEVFALPPDQEKQWRSAFPKASRNAPISFDEALERATALVEPLLNATAGGKRWDARLVSYI
jgi:Nucleotidyl transferase AbiEii toxin, Type IV TA system